MFVNGMPFRLSLMFVSKPRVYPSEESFRGRLLDFRLGTNTLGYFNNLIITAVKSFITLGPGVDLIKLYRRKFYHTFCKIDI